MRGARGCRKRDCAASFAKLRRWRSTARKARGTGKGMGMEATLGGDDADRGGSLRQRVGGLPEGRNGGNGEDNMDKRYAADDAGGRAVDTWTARGPGARWGGTIRLPRGRRGRQDDAWCERKAGNGDATGNMNWRRKGQLAPSRRCNKRTRYWTLLTVLTLHSVSIARVRCRRNLATSPGDLAGAMARLSSLLSVLYGSAPHRSIFALDLPPCSPDLPVPFAEVCSPCRFQDDATAALARAKTARTRSCIPSRRWIARAAASRSCAIGCARSAVRTRRSNTPSR